MIETDTQIHLNFPHVLKSCEQEIITSLATCGLQIQDCIGSGAQGNVYTLADNTGRVATVLKTTLPGSYGVKKFNQNRGPHLVEKIKHPGICSPTHFFYLTPGKTLSCNPSPGSICIATVMPYVKGSTLRSQTMQISSDAAVLLRFAELLTEAVDKLSENRVRHGDLHLGNILVDEDLNPVIIDFDLCLKRFGGKLGSVLNFFRPNRRNNHAYLKHHLAYLIKDSPDIKEGAKIFLQSCINKATTTQLSKIFIQACMDHLEEIKLGFEQPVSKL